MGVPVKPGRKSPVGGTVGVRVSREAAEAAMAEARREGGTIAEVIDGWRGVAALVSGGTMGALPAGDGPVRGGTAITKE